jgi:hypothetical protein
MYMAHSRNRTGSSTQQLRMQAAECEMIRDPATDKAKRELFAKLARHFEVLASKSNAR